MMNSKTWGYIALAAAVVGVSFAGSPFWGALLGIVGFMAIAEVDVHL